MEGNAQVTKSVLAHLTGESPVVQVVATNNFIPEDVCLDSACCRLTHVVPARAGLQLLSKLDISCSPNVTGGLAYLAGTYIQLRFIELRRKQ